MTRVPGWLLVALYLGLIAGCGGDTGGESMPEVDAATAPILDAASADAASAVPAAKFSEIYALLFPSTTNARCNFCHSMPARDTSNGKLSMGLDVAAAYAALMGKNSTSSMCNGKPLVVPGQPDASLFLQKLGPTPPCGSRMPVGGAALSEAQLTLVRSWIAGGAHND